MKLLFRSHALIRMIERNISKECIEKVIKEGTIIESYPDDKPYPSFLQLGKCNERPIHLVYAKNEDVFIIITVYEPDPKRWEEGFTKRS